MLFLINILEIVFQYYEYWILLNSFEHDCLKRSKCITPTPSKHYYSDLFYVHVNCN